MKLSELLELIRTYHFYLWVHKDGVADVGDMYANWNNAKKRKFDDCEVITIDCRLETSKASPITHSIDVRPIFEIVIREE